MPQEWLDDQAEKARLAKEAAEKEGEESGSRPNSKQKGKKPAKKKPAKKGGKKGKGGDEEEEKEEVYPIVNLDYACYRTNGMPTLTSFHDYYRVCKEKVLLFSNSNSAELQGRSDR